MFLVFCLYFWFFCFLLLVVFFFHVWFAGCFFVGFGFFFFFLVYRMLYNCAVYFFVLGSLGAVVLVCVL